MKIALGTDEATRNAEIYEDTKTHAFEAATDAEAELTFVHVNVPHRPVVYDPGTDTIEPRPEASYLDNLLLVDETIAELRDQLQEQDLWNETTLVLTSDHGDRRDPERVGLPPDDPEEPFPDRRVPLIVKPPEAGQAPDVGDPLDNRIVHGLALGVLDGELGTGEEIATFLTEQGLEPLDPEDPS